MGAREFFFFLERGKVWKGFFSELIFAFFNSLDHFLYQNKVSHEVPEFRLRGYIVTLVEQNSGTLFQFFSGQTQNAKYDATSY